MRKESLEFREKFFIACRDTSIETEEITAALQIAAEANPGIFDENKYSSHLEKQEYEWSEGFFQQCLHESSEVFSLTRLHHLLKVRKKLRDMGVISLKPTKKIIEANYKEMSSIFIPTENLESSFETIESNLLKAQIALRFGLYDISRDTKYLKDAVKWAESKSNKIFTNYQVGTFHKAISNNPQEWNSDYFDIQTEYLSTNFSKERYLHLIEVRQYLRDKGVEGFVPMPQKNPHTTNTPQKNKQVESKTSKPESPPQSTYDSRSGPMSGALRAALMVGGAIAALLAIVFSMTH